MERYCPKFYFDMPHCETNKIYIVKSIMIYGYWGNKHKTINVKQITGLRNAYLEARWLGLIADFRYPDWLYNCGINYSIKSEDGEFY